MNPEVLSEYINRVLGNHPYNIDVSNIKSNNIDVSFITLKEYLDVSRIDVSYINIKNEASIDCSLIFTTNNGISCENIFRYF